jgi:hypothetical protein
VSWSRAPTWVDGKPDVIVEDPSHLVTRILHGRVVHRSSRGDRATVRARVIVDG